MFFLLGSLAPLNLASRYIAHPIRNILVGRFILVGSSLPYSSEGLFSKKKSRNL